MTVASVEAEAIAGNGFGAWANASLFRGGQIGAGPVGITPDLNVNTGIGVRGGNLDVHLLGFGTKVGADGVTIDTPLGGAKCAIM